MQNRAQCAHIQCAVERVLYHKVEVCMRSHSSHDPPTPLAKRVVVTGEGIPKLVCMAPWPEGHS